eukprot:g23685.t1
MALYRPLGAHVPPTTHLDREGAIARARQRGCLSETPLELQEAGSCLHMPEAVCAKDDFTLFDALAIDIEDAGYRERGDALGPHRSRKHLQIWGDAL